MSRLVVSLISVVALLAVLVVGVGAYLPGAFQSAAQPPEVPTSVPIATLTVAPSAVPTAPTAIPSTTETVSTLAAASTAAPTPGPTGLNAREAQFKAIVDRYLSDLPGTFGVVVKDLKTGDTYMVNADRPFPSASLFKLGLVYEVYKEAKVGTLSLKTMMDITQAHMAESEGDEKLVPGMSVTIERSLWFLITLSSNSAAHALHEHISWSDMNASMRAAGFVNTRMNGDPNEPKYGDWRDEQGSTTSLEMLRYFEMVNNKQLLDEDTSDQIMYLLRHQQVDDRLSYSLPKGIVMAHKTGNLPGTINDVGIIFGPQTDLYVGVISQGADYESTTQALRGLGRALYDYANS
jgi:beta-lactamase class A